MTDDFIPDYVKQMIKQQQNFIDSHRETFNIIDQQNQRINKILNKAYSAYEILPASKYDSYIKTVGKYAYMTDSLAYNFYKPDYYKDIRSNIYNIDKYIPDYAKTDFRFQIQTQKLVSQVELLNEKFNNISNPEINEFEIKFDKLISEPLVDTTNHNQNVNNDTDIRSVIAEIHEFQKRQEETLREIVKNSKQNEPSEQSDKSFFDNFQLLIIVIFGVITKPKEFYEAVIWINDILSTLIDHFFS